MTQRMAKGRKKGSNLSQNGQVEDNKLENRICSGGSQTKCSPIVDNSFKSNRNSLIVLLLGLSIRVVIWIGYEYKFLGTPASQTTISRYWFTQDATLVSYTPVTSYESLQEATMLIELQKSQTSSSNFQLMNSRSMSPYVNDSVRTPPLVLYLLNIAGCLNSRLRQFLFLLMTEIATTLFLGSTVSRLRSQPSRNDLTVRVRRKSSLISTPDPASTPDLTSTPDPNSTIGSTPSSPFETDDNKSADSEWKWFVDNSSVLSEPWVIMALYFLNPMTVRFQMKFCYLI